jgi:hypothetical protein
LTPVRDEAENLPRLASALAAQTMQPVTWLVIDNGSTDETLRIAHELRAWIAWLEVLTIPGAEAPVRAAPIVRSLHAGIARVEAQPPPDFLINIDADISFEPDYLERLLGKFAADPMLGIASGGGYELEKGTWRQKHMTGATVWGGSRMYRWACLQDVLPFEERIGWDGIDQIKANARGWRTKTFLEIPFKHHRPEGHRDAGRFGTRKAEGRTCYYMGYRPSYLVLRALRHLPRDPAAVGFVWGYLTSAWTSDERCADEAARAYLRRQQSFNRLPRRIRETYARRRHLPAKG